MRVIANAMKTKLGEDAEEVAKVLANSGIARTLAKEAIKIAEEQGSFTVFSLVEALTRLDRRLVYASDRVAADQKAARLLALAV